jgi:hypothetical protein
MLAGSSGVSRDEGFAVMDVSTSIMHDPKVKKLWRHAPDHAPVAFTAYVSTVAESWMAGRRVNIDDAWPAFLTFSKPAIEALVAVELLDSDGLVPVKTWRGWFVPAMKRRKQARARWARSNAKRTADTASVPRGIDVVTRAPSVRPSVPSVPPERALRAMRTTPSAIEMAKALRDRA